MDCVRLLRHCSVRQVSTVSLFSDVHMTDLPRAFIEDVKDDADGENAKRYHAPEATTKALPLLLYLHGAGESGNHLRDLISDGATGTPPAALEKGRWFRDISDTRTQQLLQGSLPLL